MKSLPRTLPWNLTDLASVEKNGLTVMSTFACGGGSTMGYKRAGFDVIAANDIDPQMAEHYRRNHNPRHYYLMPIGELVKLARARELPDELYSLDILDGSPPCSSFSTIGSREKDWGKDKHFREGQAEQVLDDLFFDYLDLVEALQPRVSIAENVKGMLLGNARGYVKEIVSRYRKAGYSVQLFLVNGASCSVPQRRERVFFVATRLTSTKLALDLLDPVVSVAQALRGCAKPILPGPSWLSLAETGCRQSQRNTGIELAWHACKPGESIADGRQRLGLKPASFTLNRVDPDTPCPTLTATHAPLHWDTYRYLTPQEVARISSFPDDYRVSSSNVAYYMMGMSVPPFMTQVVAEAVRDQWLLA